MSISEALDEVVQGRRSHRMSERDISHAIQALLERHAIYRDGRISADMFNSITRNFGFFEEWFSVAGMTLTHDRDADMLAITYDQMPWHSGRGWRLTAAESAFRLALRHLHDTGGGSRGVVEGHGRVRVSATDIPDAMRALGLGEPPSMTEMKTWVERLMRHGAASSVKAEDGEYSFLLLPYLRLIVSDKWIGALARGEPGIISQDETEEEQDADPSTGYVTSPETENQDA